MHFRSNVWQERIAVTKEGVFRSEILLFEVSMEKQKHIALRKDASLDLDVTESLKRRDYLELHNLIPYKKME
jgi:hypothetical protein